MKRDILELEIGPSKTYPALTEVTVKWRGIPIAHGISDTEASAIAQALRMLDEALDRKR